MAKLLTHRGRTSKLVRIFVQDTSKTTGAGLTGLVFNSASLTAYYLYEGDTAARSISLVTAALGTWTSGGFIEVDATHMPGIYEIGIPDAALATGNSVVLYLQGATNMAPVIAEFDLVALDPQDGVHLGITALPNAVAGAAGGLPTGDASGRVTVITNSDKTGYALTSGEHTNIATDAQTGLTAQGYTTTRAGFLDTLNGLVAAIWASATRTLSAFGFSVTASTVSDKTGYALTTAEHTAISGTDVPAGLVTGHLTTARADKLDNLDAAVSTRLATGGYTAPDNSDIVAALNDLVTLLARTDPTTALAAIKTVTDQFRFTIAHEVDANALSGGGGSITVAEIWDYLTSNLTTPSSIGQFILTKLGLINATTVVVPPDTLPPGVDYEVFRGDDITLSFHCVNLDGSDYDLTSANLLFLAKSSLIQPDRLAFITKTNGQITKTSPTAGLCAIPLLPSDTLGASDRNAYEWTIKDLTAEKTVAHGTITVVATAVLATS